MNLLLTFVGLYYKTLQYYNKQECLLMLDTSTLDYYLGQGWEPTIRMGYYQCFTLQAPGVPANARPWCKYLTLANTLAYYDATTIISVKHFIVQILGVTELP
jgi:hypothetical protein